MRDEFTKAVVDSLFRRVCGRCSNPKCRKQTSGPQIDESKAINIGVGAHITAASHGGPRYDPSLSPEERSSITNGIWLCQSCAKLVDNDSARYTTELLKGWKAEAEDDALNNLESNLSSDLRSSRLHITEQLLISSASKQLIIDPNTGNHIIFDPTEGTVTEHYKNTSTILSVSRLSL